MKRFLLSLALLALALPSRGAVGVSSSVALTNISVSVSGGVTTNANQFAPVSPLTLRAGARQTNANFRGTGTNMGDFLVEGQVLPVGDDLFSLGDIGSAYAALYVKGSGVNFVETGGGIQRIVLAAPASLGVNYGLVLPTVQGGDGQVLTNDGIGNLGWHTPTATTWDAFNTNVISQTASNAAKSLMVWTNDFDATIGHYARQVNGTTNSAKVLTNGLQGIAIGDVNAMIDYQGWPYDGLTFSDILDGTAGHTFNEFFFGVIDANGNTALRDFTGDLTGGAAFQAFTDNIVVETNGSTAIFEDLRITTSGGTRYLQDGSGLHTVGFMVGTPNILPFGGYSLFAKWGGVETFKVSTNLTTGTTNSGTFWVGTSMYSRTNVAQFDFITTNLLSGQVYTNFAQRGHVVATAVLTNVLAGDFAAMALIVDQNGDGTWDSTNGPVSIQGVALSAAQHQLAGRLQPGARFAYTNQSAGATPGSAVIRPGSCQWSRE